MIELILGVPGSGKTTYLAYLARKAMKKGIAVYSNVYIEGAYIIDSREDIGKYLIENAIIIIDEGGTEYDNRNWKKLKRTIIRYYKLHRHYNVDVYISSQDYDIDIKIRNLVSSIVIVRKAIIKGIFKLRYIRCKIDIDENKKIGQKGQNIIKTFSYIPALKKGIKYIYGKKYWKYFDSYYKDKLNSKKFDKWTKDEISKYTYDFTNDKYFKEFNNY